MTGIVTQKQQNPAGIQPTAQSSDGGSPLRITTLPDKIMGNVCEFIPGQEVVRNMQCVCKSWQPLFPGTWRKSYSLTDEKFIQFIHKTQIITSLRLFSCCWITDKSFKQLAISAKWQDLITLHLGENLFITQAVLRDVDKLYNLKTFSLYRLKITDKRLLKKVAELPNLTSLSLDESFNTITNEALKDLAQLQKLEKLSLVSCQTITDEVFKNWTGLQKLTRLNLRHCISLTNTTLKIVAKFKNLTALDISQCWRFREEDIDSLIELRTLTELNVSSCTTLITNKSLAILAEKLQNLIILDIGYCREVNNEGIESLAKLPKLRELDLEGCWPITDQGLERGVTQLQNLTLLRLSGCKEITDKGLIKGVAKLPKLRELDVRYCPLITNRGLLKSVVKLSELRRLHLSQFRQGQSVQNIIDSHAEHYVQKIISIFDECGLFPKALNCLIMDYIEYFLSRPLVIVK